MDDLIKKINEYYYPTLNVKKFTDFHIRVFGKNRNKYMDLYPNKYWIKKTDKRGKISDYKSVFSLIEKYFKI